MILFNLLPFYNNDNLPSSIKMQKWVQKLPNNRTKHPKLPKDFLNFAKVAKFRQIWSHCHRETLILSLYSQINLVFLSTRLCSVAASVTNWLDYFFNLWPFTAQKIGSIAYILSNRVQIFAKYKIQALKICQRLFVILPK